MPNKPKAQTFSANELRYVTHILDSAGRITWVVNLRRKPGGTSRRFSEARHGSVKKALAAACAWRDSELNSLFLPPPRPLLAMHESSQAVGVKCLDQEWRGHREHYRFRCAHGHEWIRTANAQLSNPRCPECVRVETGLARRRHDNLSRLQQHAADRGGVCLSKEYTTSRDYYRFRCAKGHAWEARAGNVLQGSWCGICRAAEQAGKPRSAATRQKMSQSLRLPDGLQQIQEVARERGGRCLSPAYLGALVNHRFSCSKGHEWDAHAAAVARGKWCRQCRNDDQRLTASDIHKTAQANGGRCLNVEAFKNVRSRLTWECFRGHVWQTMVRSVRAGRWCPDCANMDKISSRKSKAKRRYVDGGKHLVPSKTRRR